MTANSKYTTETITYLHRWTPNLFTLRTTRGEAFKFVPGQFARLGVQKGDKIVWRAYSILSADYDEHLEFLSIVVPDGEFTSELTNLKVGDPLFVDKTAYGFLTRDRFEQGKDLWMLATGTGLAPFLSILYDFSAWEEYDRLILVQSVREKAELAYEDTIRAFATHEFYSEFAHKLHYVPIVTREVVEGALDTRITDLLKNGGLETATGIPLDQERSRIMICGNPDMVEETRTILSERGFTLSRRGAPGHLAVEQLW
ncbi:ferredoxin--NADP reductase [Amantichitinum ursilacus]|uniref:ferredoxin--NADP(+) reductase n=1 Tax=Amantichitinum ursilacus TaxID=857265 RepID=A0A0N0XJ48_9NEIS|nr:ferredoxin--NADP reductase [Amantichitinum ursilacus]KPC52971.1 Ferredoxin--NADP reductase [Amantichitinum ursilacus]